VQGDRASAVWTRSNNAKQVMSTQAESAGPRSTSLHAPPVAVIGDVKTGQEGRQQLNLRSWLTKDADSTKKKGKNIKARSESA
jgi:hypothetical protein